MFGGLQQNHKVWVSSFSSPLLLCSGLLHIISILYCLISFLPNHLRFSCGLETQPISRRPKRRGPAHKNTWGHIQQVVTPTLPSSLSSRDPSLPPSPAGSMHGILISGAWVQQSPFDRSGRLQSIINRLTHYDQGIANHYSWFTFSFHRHWLHHKYHMNAENNLVWTNRLRH